VGRLAAQRFEDHHFKSAGKEVARSGFSHGLVCSRHRLK
jgi:hypothetical protein